MTVSAAAANAGVSPTVSIEMNGFIGGIDDATSWFTSS